MYLYHYYDKTIGPFKNLSESSQEEAAKIMEKIQAEKPNAFCTKRNPDYMEKRRYYEEILRQEFLKKGGKIQREVPHYMVVEQCDFLESWYENSKFLKIPIEQFDKRTISFTIPAPPSLQAVPPMVRYIFFAFWSRAYAII